MILTPRLRLRALTLRDLALFRALYCDAKTMRHIGRPMAPTDTRVSLRATLAAARQPDGPRFFVIAERATRRAIGLCSQRPAKWRKDDIELGLMLVPRMHGRGYARETLQALILLAFSRLRAKAVWVQYRRANLKMARLCEAAGFEAESAQPPTRCCVRKLRRPESAKLSHQHNIGEDMSKIIGFLENAGRNAAMRHASREALLKAMRDDEIAPTAQHALLHAKRSVLDDLLGARETMYLKNQSIAPPKKAPAKNKPAKKAPAKKAPAKRK